MNATSNALLFIRQAILNGEFKSGEQLKAARLSNDLSVSGTVVREVFTQLNAEGLLRRVPYRGFFVQDFDLQQLADLTELRCQVETKAVQLAVDRGDLQWEAELIAAHHELAQTPRRTEPISGPLSDDWERAHKAFHRQLLVGCDSEHFMRIADNLADHTDIYRRLSAQSRDESDRDPAAEHLELLEAAICRDGGVLGARLRVHYELTATLIRNGIFNGRDN